MEDLADLLQRRHGRRQISDHGDDGSELQQIRAAPGFFPKKNPSQTASRTVTARQRGEADRRGKRRAATWDDDRWRSTNGDGASEPDRSGDERVPPISSRWAPSVFPKLTCGAWIQSNVRRVGGEIKPIKWSSSPIEKALTQRAKGASSHWEKERVLACERNLPQIHLLPG
ncbi:hypothetical protein ACLOJK_039113 [Asimina triloba]